MQTVRMLEAEWRQHEYGDKRRWVKYWARLGCWISPCYSLFWNVLWNLCTIYFFIQAAVTADNWNRGYRISGYSGHTCICTDSALKWCNLHPSNVPPLVWYLKLSHWSCWGFKSPGTQFSLGECLQTFLSIIVESPWTTWPLTWGQYYHSKCQEPFNQWHIPTVRLCVSLCVWIRKLNSSFPLICF
jgi:hypothetical protein